MEAPNLKFLPKNEYFFIFFGLSIRRALSKTQRLSVNVVVVPEQQENAPEPETDES